LNERRLLSVRRAAGLLAVALVLGLILGAQPLRAAADGISSPAARAVALTITRPLVVIDDLLHAEDARQWVLNGFGGGADTAGTADDAAAQSQDPGLALGAGPSVSPSATAGALAPGSTPVTSPTDRAHPLESPSMVLTTEGKPRFDAKRPLRVLVVGDSLVRQVAEGLVRLSDQLPLKVDYRYKVSSGLVNSGFFNWPAEMKSLVPKFKTDVTVMMYGNNDHQRLSVDGKLAAIFSPEWLDEYQRRVEAMASIAKNHGSRVIWIGMPIMRGEKFSLTASTFNKVYSGVCKQDGYWYVDSYKLFSDKMGKYAPYLPDASGKPGLVRASDGVHFTSAGGDRLAREIVRILERHYQLES
jgi:hypothetical protein